MRQRFVRSLAGAVVIVLAGGALGVFANAVSGGGIPLIAADAAPGKAIGLAAARQVHRAGGAAFVDARPRDDYVSGHIEGALNVPYGERARELSRLRRELPRTRPLVAYCEGGSCTSAFELSAWLAANGWREVSVLADGYPAWEAAGFPVTQGAAP
jgi:rhodanese-related sulfurtransferase